MKLEEYLGKCDTGAGSETLAQRFFRERTMQDGSFMCNGEMVEVYEPLLSYMKEVWAVYYTKMGLYDINANSMEIAVDCYSRKTGTILGKTWVSEDYRFGAFQVVYITHKFVKRFLQVVRFMSLLYGMAYIGDGTKIRIVGAGPRIELYAIEAFFKIIKKNVIVYHSDPVRWFDFEDVDADGVADFAFTSYVLEHYNPVISEKTLLSIEREYYEWSVMPCVMRLGSSCKIYGCFPTIRQGQIIHVPRALNGKYDINEDVVFKRELYGAYDKKYEYYIFFDGIDNEEKKAQRHAPMDEDEDMRYITNPLHTSARYDIAMRDGYDLTHHDNKYMRARDVEIGAGNCAQETMTGVPPKKFKYKWMEKWSPGVRAIAKQMSLNMYDGWIGKCSGNVWESSCKAKWMCGIYERKIGMG